MFLTAWLLQPLIDLRQSVAAHLGEIAHVGFRLAQILPSIRRDMLLREGVQFLNEARIEGVMQQARNKTRLRGGLDHRRDPVPMSNRKIERLVWMTLRCRTDDV